ncbi:hypothetical protein BASA61_006432 [Batrachochytrium salamandrivorans]|nr:hypothetical protein BASA61_006432 [Batrachochytrium salamandrivorans]
MAPTLPKLKFTYFDARMRGESTRLALHVGNVPFEDERVSYKSVHDPGETWLTMKKTMPFRQMPVMTVNGTTQIAQFNGILRYAGTLGDSIPADSAIPTTEAEHTSTTTVTTTDPIMTPIVTESQIHQAPQSSADLPNDPDRIHSESAIHAESVPISIIHKARSDTLEAANPIALATEESASDMVISGCQTQQDSIKDVSAKIKEQMDSGVDIAKELCPIKDFVYDDDDRFTFISHIAIDGIYDVPTNCIVVYDKNDVLRSRVMFTWCGGVPHHDQKHLGSAAHRFYHIRRYN